MSKEHRRVAASPVRVRQPQSFTRAFQYMVSMKPANASNSQACTPLKKLTSQNKTPLSNFISLATLTSLSQQNLNNSGQLTARDVSPHQQSCQIFTLDPSPISYRMWREKEGHPRLIFFHKPTPYGPLTGLVHQPSHSQPYFTSISCLQRASLSIQNLHSHFPSKTSLKILTFLIPKPPETMGVQTVAHLTKGNFFFFLISKKNILKEPQEIKRPTKEYRGGHKQRENTRENKKQIEQKKTKYKEEN